MNLYSFEVRTTRLRSRLPNSPTSSSSTRLMRWSQVRMPLSSSMAMYSATELR
jgi:hypothetical protein